MEIWAGGDLFLINESGPASQAYSICKQVLGRGSWSGEELGAAHIFQVAMLCEIPLGRRSETSV